MFMTEIIEEIRRHIPYLLKISHRKFTEKNYFSINHIKIVQTEIVNDF